MTLNRPAIVALTAFLAVAAADPARDAAESVKGVWAVESLTFNGSRVPDDPTAGPQFTAFDGKEYVQRQGQKIIEEGSYEVDTGTSPRAIDFVIKKGPDAGKRQLGIYELEDNTLRVCVAEPGSRKRPRSFEPAAGCLVVVNKRFKP